MGGWEGERERIPQVLFIDFCVPHTGTDLGRIELIYESYQPGDYVLTISAIDTEEQTTALEVNVTIQGIIIHIIMSLNLLYDVPQARFRIIRLNRQQCI